MEVTRYLKSPNQSALIAYFSLKFQVQIEAFGVMMPANMFVNDMKLFLKNGRKWVSFPDKKYEKDGQPQYIPYMGFTERNDEFNNAVLKAIDEFCAKTAQTQTQQPQQKPSSMDECPF
jgi:hypothetical protein